MNSMKIYWDIDEVVRDDRTVISIGTFDGVHLAHRKVIEKVMLLSRDSGFRSFIVTFQPHPQEVLKNKHPDIKLLTTTEEKLSILESLGLENVLIIKFTEDFSRTKARDFYDKLIWSKVGIGDLVVGYDHLFGQDREGNYQTIADISKELKFRVHRVDEVKLDGEAVSSSRIRKFLNDGDVEKANLFLGYEFRVDGLVIEGDKVGRQIGYPTVNITPLARNRIVPADGVYCVRIEHKTGKYFGMMYIGYRPTLTDGTRKACEVNIFDFDFSIYGEKISIYFLKHLRGDKKFDSKEELVEQIGKDRENTLNFLRTELNIVK